MKKVSFFVPQRTISKVEEIEIKKEKVSSKITIENITTTINTRVKIGERIK